MICRKCNHKLPEDSEFCQYCGSKIEKESATVEAPLAAGNASEAQVSTLETPSGDILKEIMEEQIKTTISTMEANQVGQPHHEGEADFGLIPGKPIYTLATDVVEGEHEYLNSLRVTHSGEKVKWVRTGSLCAEGIHGMVDIYDTYLQSGDFYKTVYINMYGAKKSLAAPAGFYMVGNAPATTVQSTPAAEAIRATPSQTKAKYCSRCGSAIDNHTKQCTGCGKKYFKGIRLNAKACSIVLSVLLLAAAGFIAYQYNEIGLLVEENTSLSSKVSSLNSKITSLNSQISTLKTQKSNLEKKVAANSALVEFVDDYVVFVEDDGTKLYHKFECSKFKGSSFWAFNTEAAKGKGYTACNDCH